MKKSAAIIICLLVVAILSTSCAGLTAVNRLVGSGKPASRDYSLSGFNAVDVNSAFKANIVRGDAYKVTITMDDNMLEYASVTVQGSTLRISIDTRGIPSFSTRIQEASITMPELVSVTLNGASQGTLTGFGQVGKFDGDLNGASKLSGDVQATDITLRSNGASQYTLKGKGTNLTLNGDGASQANLSGLAMQKASVTLNGASRANVNASANIDCNLNGASALRYSGSPTMGQVRVEGASSIAKE